MKANTENEQVFCRLVAEGRINISSAGIVSNPKTGKVYQRTNKFGYIPIGWRLHKGKIIHILAHRLVFLVLKGTLSDEDEVNHEDGIKINNNPSNLTRMTASENVKHAFKTGLIDRENITKALKVYFKNRLGRGAKLNELQVTEIRHRYKTERITHQELADEYGIARPNITRLISGKKYKNVGMAKL